TRADVQPPAPLRLFRARVSEHWVLDPERRPDQRTRVRPECARAEALRTCDIRSSGGVTLAHHNDATPGHGVVHRGISIDCEEDRTLRNWSGATGLSAVDPLTSCEQAFFG